MFVNEGALDSMLDGQSSRIRSFPHVQGNYALHVYIPGFFYIFPLLIFLIIRVVEFCSFNYVISVNIPPALKKEVVQFLNRISLVVPGLHVVDADVPLDILCKDDHKLEQVALGREFHISLGRTVPIRVHQIDSVVAMLRQKLQFQKGSVLISLSISFCYVVMQIFSLKQCFVEADIGLTLISGKFLLTMTRHAPFFH